MIDNRIRTLDVDSPLSRRVWFRYIHSGSVCRMIEFLLSMSGISGHVWYICLYMVYLVISDLSGHV
jgi:hypothetical protein